MSVILSALLPTLMLAVAPVLVSREPVALGGSEFVSPSGEYRAVVEYETGNTEFVPFRRFELKDRAGNTVYAKPGRRHTVLDVGDNGAVVGVDFDGPVSGRATLYFYGTSGAELGTADVGFWGRHGFSDDGNTYCVLDGTQGFRVFTAQGQELHNLGNGHSFAVSGDGGQIALAKESTVVLFRDGIEAGRINTDGPFIREMRFSPDGSLLGFVERRRLHVYRTAGSELVFSREPEAPAASYVSLDISTDNSLVAAGLDVDRGRGSGDRHRRGSILFLDLTGAVVWQEEIGYGSWNFRVPEVRFAADGELRVRTAEHELRYGF